MRAMADLTSTSMSILVMKATPIIVLLSISVLVVVEAGSEGCTCQNTQYITAPTVINVRDIGDKVFSFIEDNYRGALDPFVIGLQIQIKDAIYNEFSIDSKNKCFKTEVKEGTFEVDGEQYIVDVTLSGRGTDVGPLNTVCECKQRTGYDRLDFCNVFLRNRIFERVTDIACSVTDNQPPYCCSKDQEELGSIPYTVYTQNND